MKKSIPAAVAAPVEPTTNLVRDPPPGSVGALLNTVTKEDVIAILMQERHDDLVEQKARGDKVLAGLDAEAQANAARWPRVTAALRKTVDVRKDELAAKALTDAGFGKFAIKIDDGQRNVEKGTVDFVVKFVNTKDDRDYRIGNLRRDVTVRFNDEARKIVAEADRIRRAIGEAQQALLDIKRQITDLPNAERRARAQLAKVAIERDVDGPALLTTMREAAGRKVLGA